MTSAPQILQLYLDEVAALVMRQEFAAYRARVCMPFQLVSHDTSMTICTEDELRQGFDAFITALQIQKITDYLRLVEGAEFLDDMLISGRYITHMMAGAHRVFPPFRSQITLRREGGDWRAASISNALSNSRWPIFAPAHAPAHDPKGPSDV